ncbi:MAG: CDP-alcohol phosphatidyltransferase family protein [Acholeplasmataceae bacterium]|jgi:cardiolipin synthase|nr:CDP-alcohol phosphatidyltransferase family protein [Acholeplasmataceae bacterium]
MNNIDNNQITNKVFTIPNMLSFIRILLIPIFIWLWVNERNFPYATLVLFVSGFTDVIDGFLARKLNLVSRVGKVLDPVADKLTQAAVLLCLIFEYEYLIAAFILLAIKELILLVLGIILYRKDKTLIGSVWHGKLAAIMVYLMLFTHLAWGIWAEMPETISLIIVSITMGMMTFSLFLYFKHYLELIIKAKEKPASS